MSSSPAVRIGTRASPLALAQTAIVAEHLASRGLAVEVVRISTTGDRERGPLAALGGSGVFVSAVRDALLADRCDLAVHSLKDLPTQAPDGVVLAAVPPRADPRDALCAGPGRTLAALPAGSRIGTGSPRRAAQLLAARPDVVVVGLRGNVGSRLAQVGGAELDAVVLAVAGLARLGRLAALSEVFEPDLMVPAPGQGALAVECRPDAAPSLAAALRALDDDEARTTTTAERGVLGLLEAGCSAPVGALAGRTPDGRLLLRARVARPDGTVLLDRSAHAPWPAGPEGDAAVRELAGRVAASLLAGGAAELAQLPGRGGRDDRTAVPT